MPAWLFRKNATGVDDSSPSFCKPIPPLPHRADIISVLNQENFQVGVEIGVQHGTFTKILMEGWTTSRKFFCIDPWSHQTNYFDGANFAQGEFDIVYKNARKLLEPWSNKITIIRNYSTNAVHQFQDSSLDFAYIDARHNYMGAFSDLQMFWPKVRKGGIIAGHDFVDMSDLKIIFRARTLPSAWRWDINEDGSVSPGGKAVRSAVLDFAKSVDHQVLTTTHDSFASWFIRKCV